MLIYITNVEYITTVHKLTSNQNQSTYRVLFCHARVFFLNMNIVDVPQKTSKFI